MEAEFIQTAWLTLVEKLQVPEGSSQYVDLRRAFFAGAYTVMGVLKALGANDDDLDSDADILESMYQECEAFRLEITFDPNQN